jgi:hypothetical protein
MLHEEHQLAPVTVLRGHVSEDTAYLVGDYPYGYSLRCRIRYWLHTADRGSANGQVRFMSQTTNPKRVGEPWNKPKATTYYRWAVMVLDVRGHVAWWPVSEWGQGPWGHLRARLRTLYSQLTEDERAGYDALLRVSVAADTEGWERARRTYALIGDGVTRDELVTGHRLYVREEDYQIATAAHVAGLEV